MTIGPISGGLELTRIDFGHPKAVYGACTVEMRRHGDVRRFGLLALYLLLAFYLMQRRARLIDDLVDLLLEIVHRMQEVARFV